MKQRITLPITTWRRAYNRRRLIESALASAGFFVGGVGLLLAVRLWGRLVFPLGIGMASLAGLCVVVASVWYVRRRTSEGALAHQVDRVHGLQDLMSTAHFIDSGGVQVDEEMGRSVVTYANQAILHISFDTIGAFKWPRRAVMAAVVGIVTAALAIFLHDPTDPIWPPLAVASVDVQDDFAESSSLREAVVSPISPAVVQALREDLERLRDMRERIAADEAAREHVDQIRDRIEQAIGEQAGSSERIADLSMAERRLRELSLRGQDGSLVDLESLEQAGNEQLIESLREAVSQGDAQTASRLVEELARRAATVDSQQLGEMGQTLFDSEPNASEPGEPGESGMMSAQERQSAHQRLSEAGQDMQAQDRQGAVQELAELMEQLSERASQGENPSMQTVERALDHVRVARSEQLAAINHGRAQHLGDRSSGGSRDHSGRQIGQSRWTQRQGTGPQTREGQGGNRNRQGQSGQDGSCSSQGIENRNGQPGQSGGPGPGQSQFIGFMSEGWGLGGTNHGPGQGPTPIPWMGPLPPFEMPPSEWIESQWESGQQGVIEMIEGASHGERSTLTYRQMLVNYFSIADAMARREDIPLTRRAYIQRYFEAIRPQ